MIFERLFFFNNLFNVDHSAINRREISVNCIFASIFVAHSFSHVSFAICFFRYFEKFFRRSISVHRARIFRFNIAAAELRSKLKHVQRSTSGKTACMHTYVQGGKKSLSVAIIDEFYTIDLMEIHVKNLPQNLNLKVTTFFFRHCTPFITKVKLFQATIGRNLIVLLKNGNKVS